MEDPQMATIQQQYSGPMTEEQISLLRDMQAFIEYCIENGLSFQAAIGIIAHDVNGLTTYQNADWFLPKVKGFASKRIQTIRLAREMAADAEVRRDAEEED